MKKKGRYDEKVDWDDMTQGEASHNIGKKMTEKVQKSKKDFKRKPKHKNQERFDDYGYYPDGDI